MGALSLWKEGLGLDNIRPGYTVLEAIQNKETAC